jgi:hypothetical protein
MHPVKLPGDVGRVESRSALFGDCVSVGARQVHGLHQTYHRLRKSFWMDPMVHRGEEAQLVHLVIVLILTDDRCTVCVECTLGSEIILDAPDQTPR